MATFDSYREYITALLPRWPEYRWLAEYLNEEPSETTSTVDILDVSDDDVQPHTFNLVSPAFRTILACRPHRLRTRLIVLGYSKVSQIDRHALDALGMTFDIDPTFYWHHLSRKEDNHQAYRVTEVLPSRRNYLEFGCQPFRHASILLHQDENGEEPRKPTTSLSFQSTFMGPVEFSRF